MDAYYMYLGLFVAKFIEFSQARGGNVYVCSATSDSLFTTSDDKLTERIVALEEQVRQLQKLVETGERKHTTIQGIPSDCEEIHASGVTTDGVYAISPDGRCPFYVFCDMKNGGWTVLQTQWNEFDGKCGICGDRYDDDPGDHTVGGKFVKAERPISQCYTVGETIINITVRITSHHKGYFEFRLCENNNMSVDPTIDCFENGHLLTIAGTKGDTRYYLGSVKPRYSFQLDMPPNITCSQCILRWKYNAGNNYGCGTGSCGMGYGPQEQFINCADIAILDNCTGVVVKDNPLFNNRVAVYRPTYRIPWENYNKFLEIIPSKHIYCWSVGLWEHFPGMDRWCMNNCLHIPSYCPMFYCMCGMDAHDAEIKDD